VTASNAYSESSCCKKAAPKCYEKTPASTHLAGRKLTVHIKCVRLSADGQKLCVYYNCYGGNIRTLISLVSSEPAKALFNVNILFDVHLLIYRLPISDLNLILDW